jgi:hypothetical protein
MEDISQKYCDRMVEMFSGDPADSRWRDDHHRMARLVKALRDKLNEYEGGGS